MLREIAVPFVQQDLAPAETYAQLADSLEALIAASDSVVDRFTEHVARETGELFLSTPLLTMQRNACSIDTGRDAWLQMPSIRSRRGCKPWRSSCTSCRRCLALRQSQFPGGCPSR